MKKLLLINLILGSSFVASSQYTFTNFDLLPGQVNTHHVNAFSVHGNRLYLGAQGEPFTSDGTIAGTKMLKDIHKTGMSTPRSFTSFNGKIYFYADDGNHGYEIWVTDGTAGGTKLLKDINNGLIDGHELFVFKNRLYFGANDGTNAGLWSTDGTVQGTVFVKELGPATYGGSPYAFRAKEAASDGDVLYFSSRSKTTGNALWRTDGTTQGTVMVKSVVPYFTAAAQDVLFYKDKLYFVPSTSANGSTPGNELWVTEGTSATTKKIDVKDYGLPVTEISNLYVFNNKLYFAAFSPHKQETNLWVIDAATSIGPQKLAAIPKAVPLQPFIGLNGFLYFGGSDAVNGIELWKTDGTQAGTTIVKDIHPGTTAFGPNSSDPMSLTVYKNKLYFAAIDSIKARQLFVTDGTATGTRMLQPSPNANYNALHVLTTTFAPFTVFNDALYFEAAYDSTGAELWSLRDGPPPSGIAEVARDDYFSVYPNPSPGRFIIQLKQALQNAATVNMYDIAGRMVHSQTIERGKEQVVLQLSDVPKGMYNVTVTTGGETHTQKILIE